MKHPLQVGITGGIGSGKSLVCHIFRSLGIPIYDADTRAKDLMTSDKILVAQIRQEFGPASYLADGTINRQEISKVTFGNPARLQKLNSLVHPRVGEDYKTWLSLQRDSPYVIREAALLYEVGAQHTVDKMIVVSAPETLKIKRVLLRDPHRTENDIRAIMRNQWPEEDKLKKADHIIYNDDENMVIPQVLNLHSELLKFAGVGDSTSTAQG